MKSRKKQLEQVRRLAGMADAESNARRVNEAIRRRHRRVVLYLRDGRSVRVKLHRLLEVLHPEAR